MSCANQIKICAFTHSLCDHVGTEDKCPHCRKCSTDSTAPSIAELVAMYKTAADDRTAKTGQLDPAQVQRSLTYLNKFMDACGVNDADPISVITRRNLSKFAESLTVKGFSKVSIKDAVVGIQRMFARWALEFYEGMGRDINPIAVPEIKTGDTSYHTPPAERVTAVKMWFASLATSDRRRMHIYAMCMYHFAMRNDDVDALKWSNFDDSHGRMVLTYTPHKTSKTSGRVVRVEVCDVDAHYLRQFRGTADGNDFVIPGGGKHWSIRESINAAMRSMGFTGCKGAYELRKLCGDEYARRHGVDMAKAILGHALVTGSTAHYVDGSSQIVPTIWN